MYDHFKNNKQIQDYESPSKILQAPEKATSITVEILQGERERLYWQDVPVKKEPKRHSDVKTQSQQKGQKQQQVLSSEDIAKFDGALVSAKDSESSSIGKRAHIRFDDD